MNLQPRGFVRILLVGALTVCAVTAVSAQGAVNVEIRLPNYDVIYIADMFDVASGSLSNAIPNISFALSTSPPGSSRRVWMEIAARIQLRGDAVPSDLVKARTQPFDIHGNILISSRDLTRGAGTNVRIFPGDVQKFSATETRLRDHILNFPTAPVGTYIVQVSVYDGIFGDTRNRLGAETKVVEVKNASASEVSITLVEPQDGATLQSVLPTFSWTAEKPRARLKVYEKLPHHQSPQEAVTGIVHLDIEVEGGSKTYPPDARKLETGKTYYWFIESIITTNRGSETKQSEIRMFRVASSGASAMLQMLERLLSTYGADLAPMVTQMQNAGIQLTGDVTRDGSRVTREDLIRLFDQFIRSQTKLSVRIE
ncbi:MAG TPA: hypothetical protein VII11_12500 [Bacteroidota bacterium]